MINHESLDTVRRAQWTERFVRPLYGSYCFSQIPRLIRSLLTGEDSGGVPAQLAAPLRAALDRAFSAAQAPARQKTLGAAADKGFDVVQDMTAERSDARHFGTDLLSQSEKAVKFPFRIHRLAAEIAKSLLLRKEILAALGAVIVVLLSACSWKQTTYWRNSETLWTHTMAVTTDNDVALTNFGTFLMDRDQLDDALSYFQKALAVRSRRANRFAAGCRSFFRGLAAGPDTRNPRLTVSPARPNGSPNPSPRTATTW